MTPGGRTASGCGRRHEVPVPDCVVEEVQRVRGWKGAEVEVLVQVCEGVTSQEEEVPVQEQKEQEEVDEGGQDMDIETYLKRNICIN